MLIWKHQEVHGYTTEILLIPTNDNNSDSFKFKQRIKGQTRSDSIKDVEIMVPWKYLGTFPEILEIPLINWETDML